MPRLIDIWNARLRPTLVRLEGTGEIALILRAVGGGIVNLWVRVDGLEQGTITHASEVREAEELPTSLALIRAALPLTPVLEAEIRAYVPKKG
jgi:hypothetical protein